jgi:hypothetical protein
VGRQRNSKRQLNNWNNFPERGQYGGLHGAQRSACPECSCGSRHRWFARRFGVRDARQQRHHHSVAPVSNRSDPPARILRSNAHQHVRYGCVLARERYPERKSNSRTNLPARFQSLHLANGTKFWQRRLSGACRTAHDRSCHHHRREPRRPIENRPRNSFCHGHLNSVLSFRLPVLCLRSTFHRHSCGTGCDGDCLQQYRRHLERPIRRHRSRLRWRSLRLGRCQRPLHSAHRSTVAERHLNRRHKRSRTGGRRKPSR